MAHVHLIGISGTGLSAIARVLLERGDVVSGSDRQISPLAKALQAAGARVYAGHRAENITGAALVVRSSAVSDSNVEVLAAQAAGIPVLKRSEFLSYLTGDKRVVAVAGTHGKTTTTAMISWMLSALGQDPSYVIGSVSANLGGNAHAGTGGEFVIEADEYDRMFLGLQPGVAVVTNIEHDHPDCYPTEADFYQAFQEFAGKVADGGLLLGCNDDPGARRLLHETAAPGKNIRSYGLARWAGSNGPDYAGRNAEPNLRGGFDFEFFVAADADNVQKVSLQVPGRHNVSNALAALSVAHWLKLPLDQAAAALGAFQGTGRRFEVRGESGGVLVVDDYAHHPTEIRATLAAAKTRYTGRKIWAVWQPHTYSRTRTLMKSFAAAFEDADAVLVTEIYPARETIPADGFSSRQVVQIMQHGDARYSGGLDETQSILARQVQPGDVVMVFSAGDADQVSAGLLQDLQLRYSQQA